MPLNKMWSIDLNATKIPEIWAALCDKANEIKPEIWVARAEEPLVEGKLYAEIEAGARR